MLPATCKTESPIPFKMSARCRKKGNAVYGSVPAHRPVAARPPIHAASRPARAFRKEPSSVRHTAELLSRRQVFAASTMKSAAAAVIIVLATAAAAANEDDLLSANVNDLCTGRPDNEYFRLTTEGDCRDVVRCDRAGVSGVIRLATVKCPNSLAFDLGLQGRRGRRSQIDLSSTTNPSTFG